MRVAMHSAGAAAAVLVAALVLAWQRRRKAPTPQQLAAIVRKAIAGIAADTRWRRDRACVILSGGLDSATVAEVGKERLGLSHAFTVIAADGATDLPWASASAEASGLRHVVVRASPDQLLREELHTVVQVLQSFDPMSLRNEIAVCAALRAAAGEGFTCAVTGDGADELLGGYSFTHGLPPARWKMSQKRMAQIMQFGSVKLGAHFGIHVASPYTQPEVVRAALRYSKHDCVRMPVDTTHQAAPDEAPSTSSHGAAHEGKPLGKMPLRRAFPYVTSAQRTKDPIEVGCGTCQLSSPAYWQGIISDQGFEAGKLEALKAGVVIRDKEHLHYYWAFRAVFPDGEVPGKPRDGPLACPDCRYPLSHPRQTFCNTCGLYDPNMEANRKSKSKK